MKVNLKAAAIVVSIAILALLVVYADPAKFAAIVMKSDATLLLAALAVSTISIIFRVIKWKVFFDDIKFSDILPVQILGLTISNFSPGKIGEPAKAIILKLKNGKPVSSTLPSIIWERILDVLVLLILAIISLYSFTHLGGNFYIVSLAATIVFVLLLVIGILVLYSKRFCNMFFAFLRRLPVLNRISKNFIETFQETKIKKRKLVYCFVFTALAWVLEGFIMHYAFLSIGVNLNPFVLASVFALATMIGIATILPGGLGSTDVVLAIFLSYFGVGTTVAITGILLARFLSIWYLNLLGGLSFVYLSRKLNISMKSILK
ncbi:flippase-like domain-containing protein [archaeon]|nr:flippase-like domain-containing protein [archaeon]